MRARSLLEESLAILRETRDAATLGHTLAIYGMLLRDTGDVAGARAALEESLHHLRVGEDLPNAQMSMGALAMLLLREGDGVGAAALLREGLPISHRIGAMQTTAAHLDGTARVLHRRGCSKDAARLYGAAQAVRDHHQILRAREAEHLYREAYAEARSALGEDAFAAAWEEGRALTLDAAVALALTQLDSAIVAA